MDLTPLVVSFVTFFGIYLILALSMNLEYGLTGLPNFGKVFFYSVGAYTSAFVVSRLMLALGGASLVPWSAEAAVFREELARSEPWLAIGLFLLCLVLAALVGAALGSLLSSPALRVQDVYLALILLVVAEIARVYVRATEGFIGGPHGLGGIPTPSASSKERDPGAWPTPAWSWLWQRAHTSWWSGSPTPPSGG